jgi:uncharacterized membrane protein
MGSFLGLVIGLTVFAILVAILFVVITRGTRTLFGRRRRLEEEVSLGPLRRRLDDGEITQDQFDQAKRAIVGDSRP